MSRLLDTNVRYFDNTDFKAPKLTNAWGDIIKILDNSLVNGGLDQEVLSINTVEERESESVSYWVSTVLLKQGHNFKENLSVVRIKGCSEEKYNSIFRVQEVGEDFITIAFDKTLTIEKPLDITEEGVTINLEPLGFVKSFSEENKGVYKSLSDKDIDVYLRVDNSCPPGYDPTWTKTARVSVITDMLFIDDFKEKQGRVKVPNILEDYTRPEVSVGAGVTGYYGSSKWYQRMKNTRGWHYERDIPADGEANWELIGDNKTFYFFPEALGPDSNSRGGYCFGEYDHKTNNIYNYILCCFDLYVKANSNFAYINHYPGSLESENSFTRLNREAGNLLMNTDYESNFLPSTSENFSLSCPLANENSNSADKSTGILFDPYDFYITFSPLSIKSSKNINKGYMRGYNFILNDFEELRKLNINISLRSIIKSTAGSDPKTYVILLGPKVRSNQSVLTTEIAFELNDWS